MKIAIITINQPSLTSACNLVPYLKEYEVDVYGKRELKHNLKELITYNKLDEILAPAWEKYDAIIAILAIGAVVRKIAPLLQDKSTDPAILVINLSLERVIPLLSGHLGGANELAQLLSTRLPNCLNFLSTATDQTGTLAFEMLAKERNWRIENLKALAKISNRLINKQPIKVATYPSLFETIPNKENLTLVNFNNLDLETVVIHPTIKSQTLTFRPKIFLGIGCNRNTSLEQIEEAVVDFLKKRELNLNDIENIASFEAKADEKGVLDFAKKYRFDIKFYTKEEINTLENNFSKSASTKFFGLKGVAEPSAILVSTYKELLFPKEVFFKSITIAGAI